VPAIRHPGAVSAAAVLTLAGTILTTSGVRAEEPPAPPAPPPAVTRPLDDHARRSPSPVLPWSVPVRLDIPAIGVHTPLLRLGLTGAGTVEVPPLAGDAPAGWYDGSPAPGQAGAALVLGHVDSARDGPAVFYRLGDLRPGDTVTIRRADRVTVRFRVTGAALYPKNAVPAAVMSGPFDYAALRLITCGGSFDRARRTYRSNLVVFAVAG
jgi:hypothetical protein